MSGGFSKRVKRSDQGEFLEDLAGAEPGVDPPGGPVARPTKGFEFRPTKVDKKENQLEKKFAEIGQADEEPGKPGTGRPPPGGSPHPQPTPAQPSLLSFLDSGDNEAQYLQRVIKSGQRIVEEAAQKPLWSTGIVEVKDYMEAKLSHFETCEAAFSDKIDDILRQKLFPKSASLIPDEDLVARGEIFVVPKYLQTAKEEEGSTQEQLKRFLQGNRKCRPTE